jgi:transcription elongation factor Elf1
MAEQASKTEPTKTPQKEIKFRCRRCGRERPLSEMRSVTRFMPVLIVCQNCAKELR